MIWSPLYSLVPKGLVYGTRWKAGLQVGWTAPLLRQFQTPRTVEKLARLRRYVVVLGA